MWEEKPVSQRNVEIILFNLIHLCHMMIHNEGKSEKKKVPNFYWHPPCYY